MGKDKTVNNDDGAAHELSDEARKALAKALLKVFPYGVQLLTSAAAYTLGITATQMLGFCLRISCRTPLLGPCLGLLGVGFASALAGQASSHTRKYFTKGGNPLDLSWWEPLDLEEVALDSFAGITCFKVMGGRFSSLLPSDIAQPGALAFESIPAKGPEYADASVKRELVRIFKRDGCHHCGSRRGPVVGDHMPPNKQVQSSSKFQLPFAGSNNLLLKAVGRAVPSGKPAVQRFYPQCQRCSYMQATAMRNGVRRLVLHLHAPCYRSEHLAGVFVAMRYGAPSLMPPGGSGSSSDCRKKAAAKRPQDMALPWTPLQLTAAVVDISKAPALLGGSVGSSNAADVARPQSRYPDQSASSTLVLEPRKVPSSTGASLSHWVHSPSAPAAGSHYALEQVPAGAKMVAEAAFERRFSQRPQSASHPARFAIA